MSVTDIDTVELKLPAGVTCAQLFAASGAILNASTDFVDWEALHQAVPQAASNAISPEGRLLLDLAGQLARAGGGH